MAALPPPRAVIPILGIRGSGGLPGVGHEDGGMPVGLLVGLRVSGEL